MLNIERYKEELKKCKGVGLDCQMYQLRKECKEAESGFCFSNPCSACREDNIEWLCSEYKEQILTEKEKTYLSSVIKPFRDKVKYMLKNSFNKEFISIVLEDKERKEYFNFPYFKKGTMYQGMKANKRYTLEELGL